MTAAPPRIASMLAALRGIGAREHDEIAARVPTVLRRVGGYNLDVFNPQSERPYTRDGSVNFAHLLVGSEGTLAWSRAPHARSVRAPAHRDARRRELPVAAPRDGMHAAHRHARAHRGRAGRSHHDRACARQSGVSTGDRCSASRRARRDPAGRIRRRRGATARAAASTTSSALMGDLGFADAVVAMTEAAPQKALWDVRKAGLNIMMSMHGDGKPVSFIEDCAVPLEHLAEYVDRLTEVFARHGTRGTWYAHASVGTLHVRPILDMRARRRCEDARHRGGGERAGARLQGRVLGRARRRAGAQRMGRLAVRAAAYARIRGDQGAVRSRRPHESRQDRQSAAHGRCDRCSAFPRATRSPRSPRRSTGASTTWRAMPPRGRWGRPAAAAILRAGSARPWRCATTTAIAASSTQARCAPAFASRATRRT